MASAQLTHMAYSLQQQTHYEHSQSTINSYTAAELFPNHHNSAGAAADKLSRSCWPNSPDSGHVDEGSGSSSPVSSPAPMLIATACSGLGGINGVGGSPIANDTDEGEGGEETSSLSSPGNNLIKKNDNF